MSDGPGGEAGPPQRRQRRAPAAIRALYGHNPAHLLLLLAAAALAGYAVLHWLSAPTPVRLLVWFAAAVIGHDLIAFPVYTALDRLLIRVIAGRPDGGAYQRWRRAALNHVRFPAMLSVLLLIMWYPLILRRSNDSYFAASGEHQTRFLGDWLLVVAILFGGSLLTLLGRLALAGGRSRSAPPPPRTAPPGSSPVPSGHDGSPP